MIQIAVLLVIVLVTGVGVNVYWFFLPLIWTLELLTLFGVALLFSALNVYVRDTRYFVESANVVLFWLVPIFYPFSMIPKQFKNLYQYNPVAALVLAMREIVLEAKAPAGILLIKLTCVSLFALGFGFLVFRRLKPGFYNHL